MNDFDYVKLSEYARTMDAAFFSKDSPSSKRVVMSFSGGLDSTTLLKWFLDHDYEVMPLHFQYGSRHNPYDLNNAR